MRVLHVITGLAAGGAEQQLRLLVRHSAADSEVVALTNPGSVAEAIRAEGTPVHCLDMRGNRDLAALPRLVRLVRDGRFDLVHCHLYRAMLYGRLAARLAGVRAVVATEHSLGDELIEGRRRTAAVHALYLAAERLGAETIAVSDTVARRMVAWGVPARRISVVPNGIDAAEHRFDPAARERARRRLGLDPSAVVVGGVGRLVPTKRFDVLVRAAAGLDGVTVLLVGAGPEGDGLRRLADAVGARVVLAGESADVPAELAAMDALASPSGDETFGLAVLEALAAGLPVRYVRAPALEDLPPGSAPGARRIAPDDGALRAELVALVERARRGDAGDRTPPPAVAHYDIARLAAEVDAVHARVAGGRDRAAAGSRRGT